MKKLILTLLVAASAAGSASALDFKSYAEGVKGTKFLVNAGIGYGILPYTMSLPPISASVEYALPNLPLSVGGYFGIAMDEEDLGVGSYSDTLVGIGAKASWHMDLGLKNLDPYASLTLGWLVWTQTYSLGGSDTDSDYSTFFYSANIGARYFFTKNIGAYIELGYSAVSVASLGLAVKF
ncbi:MAG: porin family protein [Treponematales bacterium]